MTNIIVGRYGPESGSVNPDGTITQHWVGWIEPDTKEWIAFIDVEGKPTFFLDRDPVTGGVR